MEDSGARGVRKSCRARGSYNRHGSDSSPKHASALVVPESARKKRKDLSPPPGTPCSACRDPAGDESIQTAPTTQRPRREPRFTDPQVVGSSPGAPPPPPGTAPAVCGFSKLLASTGATLQAQESAGAVAAASATQQRSPSIWCVSDGEQLCTPAANSLCSAASVRSGPPCSIETHTHTLGIETRARVVSRFLGMSGGRRIGATANRCVEGISFVCRTCRCWLRVGWSGKMQLFT